jgi:PQQ-dependent catabolism-associated CXXCW motif protein
MKKANPQIKMIKSQHHGDNMSRWLLAWAVAALCALSGHAAFAMTVEVHGNQVFATGPVEDDLRKFEEAFAKPGVDTVVFVNSPGGDLWTGIRVGRLIAEKGLKTVVAGSCVSSCATMFMGGKQRQFSDALRPALTMIGIHGAHDKTTKRIDPIVQPQIYAFYKQHMGEKFNSDVMNLALYDMEDAGSLLRVFDPVRNSKATPFHCKSSQTPRDKCTKLEGKDAVNLGIVTQAELVKLSLPAAFKPANTVFGRELTTDIRDLPSALGDIAQTKCSVEPCKDRVLKFAEQSENRSIATALTSIGIGMTNNSDTPMAATVRAIYNCNHAASLPARLCEAKIVNGFDVSDLYAQSDAAHAKTLAELQVPTSKGFRTEKLFDITPQSLEGIQTIGTQELVRRLKQEGFVLFDVMGSFNTIPGSKVLLYAGHVRSTAKDDELLEKRIEGLLHTMQPDKSKPVAFFCTSRECWVSVNAAMRAKKLGYTQVYWYRGGLESWQAAGLPLVPGVIRAVAN